MNIFHALNVTPAKGYTKNNNSLTTHKNTTLWELFPPTDCTQF